MKVFVLFFNSWASCGEHTEATVEGIFATKETLDEYMKKNPLSVKKAMGYSFDRDEPYTIEEMEVKGAL